MKDIKIKRICAYVIDIFIVLILVTLLSQINVLNPYKKKYDKKPFHAIFLHKSIYMNHPRAEDDPCRYHLF